MSDGLARFNRDDSGAILLLGLAGILILMMLGWVLYDTGQVSRDKMDVQTAADTAAYSQAAVRARAMNNLAYANIAKRSVVGIHAQYYSLWKGYEKWYTDTCPPDPEDEAAVTLCEENEKIYEAEKDGDYKIFKDKNTKEYYLQDLIAIDNYQRYTHAFTPWWGWAEAVHRAARNGATMASSFPYPASQGPPGRYPLVNAIGDRVLNEVGWSPLVRHTNLVDTLPVMLASHDINYDDGYHFMLENGMGPEHSFYKDERNFNNDAHKAASEGMAGSQDVLDHAFQFFPGIIRTESKDAFGKHGEPWTLFNPAEPARWSLLTSNLVFTYRHEKELFGDMRNKYGYMKKDYSLEDEEKYRSSGYWGMARAEMSFQGGFRTPDLWHPRWTARMRPVALPGEMQKVGVEMSSVYHDMLPFLAFSGILITGSSSIINESFDDLVFMERATRALGHSTVEGITK
ncbi:pilus assembly protein TadG-related protein [Bradymonas sediminis]|nr:pilus assembly protein TadG-related protein [Bradymonas sediminis]